jgi:hypothetical protein
MYHKKGKLSLQAVVKAKILRQANRTVQEAIQRPDLSILGMVMQARLSDQSEDKRAHV